MVLLPLEIMLLVMDHLSERKRVRFLITCKAYRGLLETRMQKARAVFDAVKSHGFLDKKDQVNLPVLIMPVVRRYTRFIGLRLRRCILHIHFCSEIKVGIQTDGLICIRTIRSSVADDGYYSLLPGFIRHFVPWKGTLIHSDGREECVKDAVVKETVLKMLIAACRFNEQ
jgi:hypothetical protein